jgi:precorrin-6A synthase
MIELLLIGIGTGDPDHLTGAAIKALNRADLVLIPEKGVGKADLADLRRDICARFLTSGAQVAGFDLPVRDPATPDYLTRVTDWHDAIAGVWQAAVDQYLPQRQGIVALLVWGDPSLYDSTLRIAARLPVRVTVVPGITSLQLLTAAHAIPLNDLGEPFVVTTGRNLRTHGFPAGIDTLAVMLDGECSFQAVPAEGVTIYWGAYLGMAEQMLMAGPLAKVGPRIVEERAAARAAHGWIMDIYILRRDSGSAAA